MVGNGVPLVEKDRIVPPDDPLFADFGREGLKGGD